MTIETATYISSLNAANPAATDPKSEGDDHIRLLKSTVKATFPNVSGAVTPTHTELNYVAGVTSAIQTQINTKTTNSAAAITGGTINNASVGATTPSTGAFTTLSATGNATLGDAAATDVHSINGATTVTVNSASAALTVTQSGAGDTVDFTTGAGNHFVYDTNGRVIANGTAPIQAPGTTQALLSVYSSNPFTGIRYSSGGSASTVAVGQSRGAVGAPTIAQSGDVLGVYSFVGDNGVNFSQSSYIHGAVEGNPTSTAVPGRISFYTTRGGSLTISTAVRASNTVTITCTGTVAGSFAVGDTVVIAGVTDTGFNGSFTIVAIPSGTSFTYAQTAADASSSGGTAEVSPTSPSQKGRFTAAGTFYVGSGNPSNNTGIHVNRAFNSITGNTSAMGVYVDAQVQQSVSDSYTFRSTPGVAAAATTLASLTHYVASQGTYSATPVTQFGYNANSSLVGAAQNYAFFSGVAAGTDYTITQVALATNVATITTSAAHGLGVGSLVEVRLGAVTAGSFTVGGSYVIASAGTTDFTLIGAANSNVGTTFTATGVGTGTGTATLSSASTFNSVLNVTVTSVPTTTTFTFAKTASDVAAVNIGGTVFNHTRFGIYTGSASNYLGGRTKIINTTADDALRITNTGTGNSFVVEDSTDPDVTPFVVDSIGGVIVGHTARLPGSVTITPQVQIHGQSATAASLGSFAWTATGSTAPQIQIGKSASATIGNHTLVASGDNLGDISFSGSDGTGFIQAAKISVAVDGTPGTNDMPGRLVFSTTADGASTPTERMRIDSAGQFGFGSAPTTGYIATFNKDVTGNANAAGIRIGGTIKSDVTSSVTLFSTRPITEAAAFTLASLYHYATDTQTLGAGSTVTNQYGFFANSTLTGATNNYGFYGNIAASGTSRYNFYAAGTAPNAFSGDVKIFGAGGLGYDTGSGGTVTQATSRTTGVTLNKTNGAITLFTAAGSATATTFTVTNSTVAATDVIQLSVKSGTNVYLAFVTAVAAGSFNITFQTTGGTASDAPVINFAVIKAVAA